MISIRETVLRSERVREPLEPSAAHGDDLERRLEAVELGVRREPCLGRDAQAPLLLRPDHLEGVAEAIARLGLHLAEDHAAAAARDEVELVAADPLVSGEDPEAAQEVMEARATLDRSAGRAGAQASPSQ